MPDDEKAFPWHRVFHPLCGADPLTLAELVVRRGPPSAARLPAFALAAASSIIRLPFTLAERLLDLIARPSGHPPVFIVGHPRSGTTHLHNALAASGAFTVVPPVIAALPWETRTVGPFMRPFIEPRLPRTRLIDSVELRGDDPTEDEIGLANAGPLSYFHAFYFPRRFADDYRDGLLHLGSAGRRARRQRAIRRFVRSMDRRGAAPLLLKNPAYTANVDFLLRLFPGAQAIHIHRDPAEVFASARRAFKTTLAEMAMQDPSHVDIDAAILETYPEVMDRLRRARSSLSSQVFAELAFADLVAKPDQTLRRLWRQLDLPGGEPACAAALEYCAGKRGYRSARSRLSLAELTALRQRWAAEFAAYGRPNARETG
jgi:omega-hydroxy-beta-dihydromenaquinone-9 sulfotransferase